MAKASKKAKATQKKTVAKKAELKTVKTAQVVNSPEKKEQVEKTGQAEETYLVEQESEVGQHETSEDRLTEQGVEKTEPQESNANTEPPTESPAVPAKPSNNKDNRFKGM